MKTMSVQEAKSAFGSMIDTARAEPVLFDERRRGVVVVISVEEYERLNGASKAPPARVNGRRTCAPLAPEEQGQG